MTALAAEQIIAQQLQNLQQLEDLLVLEKEVLQNQDPEALISLTEKKSNLLQTIQLLDDKNSQSSLAAERMKNSLLENHNRSSMTYNSKGKKSGGLSSLGIKA